MFTPLATGESPPACSHAHKIFIAIALLACGAATLAAEPQPASNAAANAAEVSRIDQYVAGIRKDVGISKRTVNKQGEAIDCVDVRRQPGTRGMERIQLEPSAQLNALLGHVTRPSDSEVCPSGSVEMKLPTRADVLASGGLDNYLSRGSAASGRRTGPPSREIAGAQSAGTAWEGSHWAVVESRVEAIAAQTTMSLWRPAVPKLPASQKFPFSLSQMWVAGGGYKGGTGPLQTVEAGAQVYQAIAGDTESRFFIYWTADGYKDGCYNLRCAAFVVTSSVMPIGSKLPASKIGSPAVEGTIAWYRDPETGNWFLFLHDTSNGYRHIGYYPASIFGTGQLTRHATAISFGGEVYVPDSGKPTLPMGSGINPLGFPGIMSLHVAYHRGLIYMGVDGVVRDLKVRDFWQTPYATGCAYGFWLHPAENEYARGWGTTLFFGGQGTTPTCPM